MQVALADLGVHATDARRPRAGRRTYLLVGRTDAGAESSVRVYGRDAWDSQVVGSLWTALTRRGERAQVGGSRRSRVEHEALMTLLAAQAGVGTLDVVAVGVAEQGDALLVSQRTPRLARRARELEPDLVDDELLGLDVARRDHAERRRDRARTDRPPPASSCGPTAPSRSRTSTPRSRPPHAGDLRTDQAQLLVATALAVGPDRAIAAAVAALGAEGLVAVLPYLQPAALGRGTRADVRAGTWSLDELRAAAVAATGVEEPPLERLRRVTPRSIGALLLVAFVVYVVITLLAGADLASVAAALKSAAVPWLVAALVLSPFIQTSTAVSTIGAASARLRYFPVLMLQYAVQFFALVLPATAARLALLVRFFQRFGIPAAAALSFSLLDSVSGFVVQVALILVILVSGLPGFTSSIATRSADSGDHRTALVAARRPGRSGPGRALSSWSCLGYAAASPG